MSEAHTPPRKSTLNNGCFFRGFVRGLFTYGSIARRGRLTPRKRCLPSPYQGAETPTLRQSRLQLNPKSTAVSLSIRILKYVFIKGNPGIIFDFERPKAENTHWMLQHRDE